MMEKHHRTMRKNDDTYGLGTETNYGHMALANNLSVANYQHGLALSANQGKVLNDRLVRLENLNIVTITSSGNWTVPSGINEIKALYLIGGGGGGGSSENYTAAGGGGGGTGGIVSIYRNLKVTPSQSIPIIIGAGGIGGPWWN